MKTETSQFQVKKSQKSVKRALILHNDDDSWPTIGYSAAGPDADTIVSLAGSLGVPVVEDAVLLNRLYSFPRGSRIPERFIQSLLKLYRRIEEQMERRFDK